MQTEKRASATTRPHTHTRTAASKAPVKWLQFTVPHRFPPLTQKRRRLSAALLQDQALLKYLQMSLKEQRFSPGKTSEPTVSYPQRTRCQTRGQKWADMQEIRLEEASPTGTVWRKLGEVARVVRTCLKGQRATGKTGMSPKKCHGWSH